MKSTLLFLLTLAAAALPAAASEPTDRIRDYQYDATGNILRIGSDVFTYDGVDRVLTGTVNGRQRAYTYDAFGNRRKCTDVASNSDCQYGAAITSSTNRINGAAYDDQGDLTQYAGQTYDYDETGMLKRGPGNVEYIYTADDERIAVAAPTGWTWSLRDASGKVLREMTSTAAGGTHVFQWTRDYIFRNGTLLSSTDPTSGTRHYHTDHLGTPRVVSDTTGAVVGVHDYFAFGLEVSGENPAEPNAARLKFTGHERDASGLDYMHARFYSAQWGRFVSVDPTWRSADLDTPQSWNRYAYVQNNPIGQSDPDGRDPRISRFFRSPFGQATEHLAKAGTAMQKIPVVNGAVQVGDGVKLRAGPLRATAQANVQLKAKNDGSVAVVANIQATSGTAGTETGQRLTVTTTLYPDPKVKVDASGIATAGESTAKASTNFQLTVTLAAGYLRGEVGIDLSETKTFLNELQAAAASVVDESANAIGEVIDDGIDLPHLFPALDDQ